MLTRDDLQRVYWLSGSTCAGKTTISTAIATQLGWNVYHCDEHEVDHRHRADREKHPKWYSYSRLTGDELWLRPVEQHVQESEAATDEQLKLILDDIECALRADSRPLLYDGYIAPRNLVALQSDKHHAFYLVATEEFQRYHYSQRPWIERVLSKTSDPSTAWENWMKRDARGARVLEQELDQFELAWRSVDGTVEIDTTIKSIIEWFQSTQRVKHS